MKSQCSKNKPVESDFFARSMVTNSLLAIDAYILLIMFNSINSDLDDSESHILSSVDKLKETVEKLSSGMYSYAVQDDEVFSYLQINGNDQKFDFLDLDFVTVLKNGTKVEIDADKALTLNELAIEYIEETDKVIFKVDDIMHMEYIML